MSEKISRAEFVRTLEAFGKFRLTHCLMGECDPSDSRFLRVGVRMRSGFMETATAEGKTSRAYFESGEECYRLENGSVEIRSSEGRVCARYRRAEA
jgi:hypothetical protein